MYNLFSADPAGFTSWTIHFKNTFAAFHLGVCNFFLAMDAFTWDKRISLAAYLLDFFKIIWNDWSLITRYRCIGWSVPTVCAFYLHLQTVETIRSQCIFMCRLINNLSLSNSILGQGSVISDRLQCTRATWSVFLQSPIFCIIAWIWNLHYFMSIFLSQFSFGF